MKVLILDNFDSFTYNIQHYLESEEVQVEVFRAAEISIEEVRNYDRIILSPGPGLPAEHPFMKQILEEFIGHKPILGVCLGMQAIVTYYGGELYNLNQVKHGIQEEIIKLGTSVLLRSISENFRVGLYHSWACRIKKEGELKQIAKSASGVLMAVESTKDRVFAVQFHPESVLTPEGKAILKNFVNC